jgi:hypothetical protein
VAEDRLGVSQLAYVITQRLMNSSCTPLTTDAAFFAEHGKLAAALSTSTCSTFIFPSLVPTWAAVIYPWISSTPPPWNRRC